MQAHIIANHVYIAQAELIWLFILSLVHTQNKTDPLEVLHCTGELELLLHPMQVI